MNQNYVYCQRCGNASLAGSQFCQSCGSPLQAASLPPTQVPVPQQYVPPANVYPGYVPPQQPKKKDKAPWIILAVVLVLAVAVVAVLMLVVLPQNNAKQAGTQTAVALQNKQQATAQAATEAVASQKTVQAIAQLTVNAYPTPQPTEPPLPTPDITGGTDYSSITLNQDDFPAGFELLTPEEAASMGFGVDAMSSSLAGFTSADPVFTTTALLLDSNNSSFEVVFAMVSAPLSQSDITGFENEISNPEVAKASFASGLGGDVVLWPDAGYLGNGSIGFTYSIDSAGTIISGDVVIGYRGDAMFMVMSMWLDATTVHQADTLYLASRLDDQIFFLQP
jgi:hypothetical protein